MSRSAAERTAWARHWRRSTAPSRTVFVVGCDAPCCPAVFEGTNAERRRARWVHRWRRRPGSGIEEQIDLCPSCKRKRSPPGRKPRFELAKPED